MLPGLAELNELGAKAVALRTQDAGLARRRRLKLESPLGFLAAMRATKLPFAAVLGLSRGEPPTSVKLPGVEGLGVGILAPGPRLGASVAIPELLHTTTPSCRRL